VDFLEWVPDRVVYGNPLSYRGWTNTWEGRQLKTTTNGTDTLSFLYNTDGIRTKKNVNGTVAECYFKIDGL